MGAPRGEIDVKRVEVDLEVRHRLACVKDEDRADLMGTADDGPDVGDGTRGVAHVRDGDDLGVFRDHLIGGIRADAAVFGQIEPFERGTGAVCQLLERQQHGMVLGLGYDDLVAGLESEPFRRLSPTAQTRVAERGGKKIQSRGGPGGDDDLLVALLGVGSDQAGDLRAGVLERHGAAGRQLMRPAVHAGVDRAVKLALRIDHALRLLRGGRGIQIDERMPVDLLIQNRELRPNRRKINHCFP